MATEEIKNRVLSVIHDLVGKTDYENNEIAENSKLDDFCDELDNVEICMELESEFGFQIFEDEWEKVNTVKDILTLIEKKESENGKTL